jgi:hypothetical protein
MQFQAALTLVVLFLSGCASSHGGPAGTSESPGVSTTLSQTMASSSPAAPAASTGANASETTHVLAFSDFDWVGSGSTTLSFDAPGNTTLAWGIFDKNQEAIQIIAATRIGISMQGCPDNEVRDYAGAGTFGGKGEFINPWCERAPAGASKATVVMDQGVLQGRVCIFVLVGELRSAGGLCEKAA